MAGFGARLRHAWNAFTDSDSARNRPIDTVGGGGSYFMGRQDRIRPRFANERSIISSIYTRIGIDVAAVPMRHVRTDDQNRYLEDINSGLDNCLTLEANIDQAGTQFRQDIAMTVMDEGVACIVPVDTTLSPEESAGGYDIKTMRVGRITSWFPKHVRVALYNEERGMREELTLPKRAVAIIENPLYSVMNEPNSTLQRLLRKLSLLDELDEKTASGKLDLIIQLPYVIKSEQRREQAQQRLKDIEFQLSGTKYGVAYTDGTEKIVQLNRAVENTLLPQIQELKTQLYAELGLTPEVMNGTADESVMLNYHARTIKPLLDAIVEAMIRTFLTKTARTQGQSIMYFRDPFKYIPLGGENGLAKLADVLARNEIVSSNEVRQGIGMKPRPEPRADALINSNMPKGTAGEVTDAQTVDSTAVDITNQDQPDPEVTQLTQGLTSSEAEIDAALAGG